MADRGRPDDPDDPGVPDPDAPPDLGPPAPPVPAAPRPPATPRVGGLEGTGPDDWIVWCGGTQNGDGVAAAADRPGIHIDGPKDILAYRPAGFRAKQKQHKELKRGLSKELHLELPVDGKLKVPVMTWVQELSFHLSQRGMEGVFCVRRVLGLQPEWYNLLKEFGKVMTRHIEQHIQVFEAAGVGPLNYDIYDKENLCISSLIV